MLDKNWTRDYYRSIGYPIGTPSKLYHGDQATIKILLSNKITPQARPLDVLITSIHELHLIKTFEMMYTQSNMQLADLNYKPHEGKSLRNLIDCSIGDLFYTPPVSVH